AAIDRKVANLAPQYPTLSLAVLPVSSEVPARGNGTDAVAVAGAWKHLPPPGVPAWIETTRGFRGVVAYGVTGQPDEEHLVIRAVAPTADGTRMVIADLPVDTDVVARLDDQTGARMGEIAVDEACGGPPPESIVPAPGR